jgi:hypothetical protein
MHIRKNFFWGRKLEGKSEAFKIQARTKKYWITELFMEEYGCRNFGHKPHQGQKRIFMYPINTISAQNELECHVRQQK